MLRWPSPWHTSSVGPPPKTSSVIDKWLVDTGRKPLPRARYTARGRRAVRGGAPSAAPTLSFPLVWPTRSDSDVSATTKPQHDSFVDRAQSHGPLAPAHDACADNAKTVADGNDDAADPTHDATWDEPSYASIYHTNPTDWRERITEMIDMGMTHYNVCNCTEGVMPTKDDIERYDAIFREVVAENPEVGSIDVIPGYPPIYVLLGAADAAQLYAERRRRERDERRQGQ